jgi:hypothetical protein
MRGLGLITTVPAGTPGTAAFNPGAAAAARAAPVALQSAIATGASQTAATVAMTNAMTQAAAPFAAYQNGINAVNAQGWPALPLGPYPPAGDTTNFPRTGDPSLIVNPAGLSLAQLAEPGKVTLGIAQQQAALEPQLNALFWIGAAGLVGYFLLRD